MAGSGPPGLPSSDLSSLAFLAGGGEMGERMRALDWSKTPLGDPHRWPQSLRSTLSMLLPSKAQIILPGSGSSFVIQLPLDGARPRLLPAVANKRQAAGVGGLRVLIADDDADARDVLRMLLEAYGNEVVAVASAADALAALTASAFDALIADIGMPSQDGYSLMRAIRDLPTDAVGAIPAIAVTAYASLKERDEALSAGFTAHMGKPFDPDRLIETLAKIARARPVTGSA